MATQDWNSGYRAATQDTTTPRIESPPTQEWNSGYRAGLDDADIRPSARWILAIIIAVILLAVVLAGIGALP